MFRHILMTTPLIALLIAGCTSELKPPTGPGPLRAAFTVEATVEDFHFVRIAPLPFLVSLGETVEVTVSFARESEDVHSLGSSSTYEGFEQSWISIRTRTNEWTVPLTSLTLRHGERSDHISARGESLPTSQRRFDGQLETALIYVQLHSFDPARMLESAALGEVNAGAAAGGSIEIQSESRDRQAWRLSGRIWPGGSNP